MHLAEDVGFGDDYNKPGCLILHVDSHVMTHGFVVVVTEYKLEVFKLIKSLNLRQHNNQPAGEVCFSSKRNDTTMTITGNTIACMYLYDHYYVW